MRLATYAIAASAAAMSAALVGTVAIAQDVNLTGRWQCVRTCASDAPGLFAYVTQYGRELNVLNEVGMASRAWIDYPGRIWVERAHQGAIYSPDGMTIQFDSGTIWQRAVEIPTPAPVPRRR